ncbi:diguanylate cyclase domain-containing protein [Labrys portucalensis]|uniref:diguanylate cyclase n=1 Tax=Labrys neptuniae TaxID=376174 RepID=A0ABV3PGR1_9HYPH|nr:diguanylate cyclase [Labrys neptuniae]MDT3377711.1 diguanylate cyclase [Labrys neptuniae]
MSDAFPQTVLIVDDDRINRTILAELLQRECRILLAKDGPSALQRAQDERSIDLILLDVSMPGMDGYEVLRRLRSEPQTANIAVIFITALTDEQDEERGLSLGAADYVFKPISPAIVRARVRNHLKLVAQRNELERLSEKDGLTGIANRRYFDKAFELAWRHAVRSGDPLSVAMIDVDHFKEYNDHYGHGAGDEALRQVAQALARAAGRPYDVVARYGGEEFVMLLPGLHELEPLLERLRQAVLDLDLPHARSRTAEAVTISCGGVVAFVSQTDKPAALLGWADKLLYRAKQQGRNRVLVWQGQKEGLFLPVGQGGTSKPPGKPL